MLKWIDIPPLWLFLGLGGSYGLDQLISLPGFGKDWLRVAGNLLILGGLGTMAAAMVAFLRARTSVIPRRVPSALLKDGIYRFTRNPIYLGDAMVLLGAILRWDVPIALPLVPLFGWFIQTRFIRGEEDGLIARFGDEAEAWMGRVRRWV